jgi:hypothetical protein
MNAPDRLLYANDATAMLSSLAALLQRWTPICNAARPIPGLPCIPEDEMVETVWDPEQHLLLAHTPWGMARVHNASIDGNWDLYEYMPMYQVIIPNDTPLPKAQLPVAGYAVMDGVTGMTTVFADGDDGKPVEVFHTRLNLDGGSILDKVKRLQAALARAGVPVLPTRLYRDDSLPYPWKGKTLEAMRASNREVMVPLVGFALDRQTEQVIYLHVVGAKTAIRSIWATLCNGSQRKPLILQALHQTFSGYGSPAGYVTISTPVCAETGDYRLVMIDRRAVEREVTDVAYLVLEKTPAGLEEAEAFRAFAARLDAVLPVPVLPAWGKTLGREGSQARLVRKCAVGGDAADAYAIQADERWLELISGLVQSGELLLDIPSGGT